MHLNICRGAAWLPAVVVLFGAGANGMCQQPSPATNQEKQSVNQDVDPATRAAYEKLGASYGKWPANAAGMAFWQLYAKEGLPGFTFAPAPFPKTKLPDVPVPFCLDLAKSPLSDQDLKQITGLYHLVKLSLSETHVTDKGLKELSRLKKLDQLCLNKTNITDHGLADLVPLENLTILDLTSTKVTDAGLKKLATLTKLRVLDLNYTDVSGVGLEALADLKDLTDIGLFNSKVKDDGFKHLVGCRKLSTIGIGRTLTDKSVQALQEIGLLHACGGAIGKDWARPKSAEDVVFFDLHECKVTNATLKPIAALKNLETLDLGFTLVKGGLDQLPEFSKLATLMLSGTMLTENTSALARCKDLSSLYLQQTNLSVASLKELSQLKALRMVDFQGSVLPADGVKELAALKNLKSLSLINCNVTDDQIIALRRALPGCTVYPSPKQKGKLNWSSPPRVSPSF